MVFREAFESHDFRRMCKHVERGHELKKLSLLLARLNQQLADQGRSANRVEAPASNAGETAVGSQSIACVQALTF